MISLIAGAFLATSGQMPAIIVKKSGQTTSIKFENGLLARKTNAQVTGARTVEIPGTSVRIAAWNESTRRGSSTPYYAISLNGTQVDRVTATNYDVQLQYGSFDPAAETLQVSPNLSAGPNNEVFIVQFDVQPLQEMRDAVESAGGEIYHYMTNHSYLIRLNSDSKSAVEALPFVRAVTPYHPAYKTDAGMRSRIAEQALPSSNLYNIQLLSDSKTMMDDVVAIIELGGGEVTRAIPENSFLTARLNPSQFVQLLHMNEVSFADQWSAPETDMDILRELHGVNYIAGFGNFEGANFRGAVMDGGLVTNHIAWATRPPIVQTANSNVAHGTACYGINFGDGTGNAAGKGILPQGTGVFAAYTNYLSGGGDRNALSANVLTNLAPYQSNSWGDALTTTYTTISAQMDSILYNNEIVILQSQSNAGTTNSRPQAWAKNIVSVGGIKHFNNTNWNDDNWTNGASTGPAADGRLKPDLSNAYDAGTTTYTTSTTGYGSFSGTSQATPLTAGLFGVFYQVWGQGFFGTPQLQSSVFLNRPKPQLAKAFMVNTARMYDTAINTDCLRVRQGWGTASLQNLWNLRNDMFFVNETDVLLNLQSKTYKLHVAAGTPALKATMAYLDPAGTVGAAVARKNNLSLKVTSPGGVVYWGNNGMGTTSNWSTSGGVENAVDTVENVNVQNPATGTWTVEVIGSDINTDARTETAATIDADFALVVSGVVHSIAPTVLTPQSGTLFGGGLNELARSDNAQVLLQNTDEGDFVGGLRHMTVDAISPVANLSKFGFVVEGRTGLPSGRLRLFAYDYTIGSYILLSDNVAGSFDTAFNFETTTNPNRFVDQTTRAMSLKLQYRITDFSQDFFWHGRTDLVRFQVQPQ